MRKHLEVYLRLNKIRKQKAINCYMGIPNQTLLRKSLTLDIGKGE